MATVTKRHTAKSKADSHVDAITDDTPGKLTIIERLSAIERFLNHEPDRHIAKRIHLSGERAKALEYLRTVWGSFRGLEMGIARAGEPRLYPQFQGLDVKTEAGNAGLITWDEVIDEEIDADAGAETWEVPETQSSGQKMPARHTPKKSPGADVVFGPNGPIPINGQAVRSVNGKPKRTAEATAAPDLSPESPAPFTVPLLELARNRFNPRTEFPSEEIASLATSLATHGQVQAILVRRAPVDRPLPSQVDPSQAAVWEIVAGERRCLAAQRLGWKEIQATVSQVTDDQARELALVENLERQDLSAIDKAKSFRDLIAHNGYTVTTLAARFGKVHSYISNHLALLELPGTVQERVATGVLPPTHARALTAVKDAPQVIEAVEKEIERAVERAGGVGTVKEFERTVENALWDQTADLTQHVSTRHAKRYKSAELRIDSKHPRYAELQVIEVKHYGSVHKRALNVKLAKELLAEKAKAWRAKHDSPDPSAGGGKGAKGPTPAELKARAEEARKKYLEDLREWFDLWRCASVAARLKEYPDVAVRLMLLAYVGGGGDQWANLEYDVGQQMRDRWKPKPHKVGWRSIDVFPQIWSESIESLQRVTAECLAAVICDGAAPSGVAIEGPDLDALCQAVELDLHSVWTERGAKGQAFAGELTEAYFELHSLEQLQELSDEWKLHLQPDVKKPEAIKYLTSQTQRILPLPAELAELLPKSGRKSKAKAKR